MKLQINSKPETQIDVYFNRMRVTYHKLQFGDRDKRPQGFTRLSNFERDICLSARQANGFANLSYDGVLCCISLSVQSIFLAFLNSGSFSSSLERGKVKLGPIQTKSKRIVFLKKKELTQKFSFHISIIFLF